MAKPPAPPAFNPDGTPKGHRATVSGHSSADDYEVEPAEVLHKHDVKPSPNPASPDIEKLHSKHTTPEQETPFKKKPESGKLRDGVESHARYSAEPDVTTISSDETVFSPSTTTLIAVLAGGFGLVAVIILLWMFMG